MACTGAACALAAVLVGRIGDRVGHRRLLPVCLLGAAITCLPQVFVRTPGELFAWRVAQGLFLGGLMPSANALLAGLVPTDRRGSAFGLAGTAASLANAAGPLSGAFLGGALGMSSVFYATAVLYIMGLVFMLSRFRQMPMRVGDVRDSLFPPDPA
jgi:MFS transporter, DHA1 family, multidrug resistance protein